MNRTSTIRIISLAVVVVASAAAALANIAPVLPVHKCSATSGCGALICGGTTGCKCELESGIYICLQN